MTLNKKNKDRLIKYRLDQSHESVDEVAFLLQNGKLKTAINMNLL